MNISDIELYYFFTVISCVVAMTVAVLLKPPESGRGRYLLAFILASSLIALAFDTVNFRLLMQEDGPVEWATFYLFIYAGGLFFWRLLQLPKTSGFLQPLSLVALACFCLFVAGEEISWGQRLLGFKPPEIFLEHNFQQEANVHNFLNNKTLLGISLDSRNIIALIACLYGVLLPVLGRIYPPIVRSFQASVPEIYFAGFFLLLAWVEWVYPVSFGGEAAEFYLACLFLLSQKVHIRRGEHLAFICILVLAVATAPLANHFIYGSSQKNTLLAKLELEQLAQDFLQHKVLHKKFLKKTSTHKRLYTAEKAGHFTLQSNNLILKGQESAISETGRRDRLGYYLDPWNNPYWMHWQKKATFDYLFLRRKSAPRFIG